MKYGAAEQRFDMDINIKNVVREYEKRAAENQQLVTVFMLTYNRAHYVMLAIESVLKQTYENFTLILLDNCSTDNTQEEISKIKDPRLLYIKRSSVVGDSNAKFANSICITPYYIVLHDDDLVEPEYLQEVVEQMECNDYSAMSTGGIIIDEDGNKTRDYLPTAEERFVWKNGEYLAQYLRVKHIGMIYPSVIYRKSFYKNLDSYNVAAAGPAGDQAMWFLTERNGGTLALYNKPLMRYRRHKKQDSNANDGYMTFQLFDYLLSDDYYRGFLEKDYAAVNERVFRSFATITLKYCCRQIDEEKYSEIFDYKVVREMPKHHGKRYYILMKCVFALRPVTKHAGWLVRLWRNRK